MRKILLGLMALSLTTAMAGTVKPYSIKANPGDDRFSTIELSEKPVVGNDRHNVARAAESDAVTVDFSYAGEHYSSLGLNNIGRGYQVAMAMYISPETATAFEGAEIKAINLYTGSNSAGRNNITKYAVFVQETLESDPIYAKPVTVEKIPNTRYSVPLDTTLILEAGKGLYIGYYCSLTASNEYYIPVDGIPTTDRSSSYVGTRKGTKGKWAWMTDFPTEAYGSICIGATLEATKYPVDAADMFGLDAPLYVAPGTPFSVDAYIRNACVNKVSSIEFECKVGNSEPVNMTAEVGIEGINSRYSVKLDGLVSRDNGSEVPVEVKVVKVNGVDNTGNNTSGSDKVVCFPEKDGFKSYGLIEEGTGTWCGWCPMGIVMMEYAKEKYPDVYNRIALHNDDRMSVPTGETIISAFFSGFPEAMMNRMENFSPQLYANILDGYYDAVLKYPTWAGFNELNVVINEKLEAEIESKSSFLFETQNDNRYRIGYYITEDGLGPYPQTNYFAGGANGEFGGWEKKGKTAMTIYDDVVRLELGGVTGFRDSYPSKIEANSDYVHKVTASTAAIEGENFFVTAFIVDNETGVVINSYQVKASKAYNAVAGVENDGKIIVNGAQGCIVVDGDFAKASIYSLAGQKMAEINAPENVVLPAGIYVVNADGFVKKVVVK